MRYLITSALPYANAPLHIGHVLEIVQTDVWVRSLKLAGNEVFYYCASDTHGTPIMLKAQELNTTPEELSKKYKKLHSDTYKSYNVDLNNFHTTHSKENKELTEYFFNSAYEKGDIYTKEIEQLFDEQKNIFLSDRFVKGECPSCEAKDQYGDACEVCGKTYDALDLKNPYSTLSNSEPVIKKSKHYFFKLNNFKEFLNETVSEISNQDPIKEKLKEWFDSGLKDWDISRDEPYFGFKIPNEDSKYLYVWLDAPIGYLSSIKNWCDSNNIDFNDFINESKIVHFIGKDIVYFHLLFWPATLKAANFPIPNEVYVHGFLTVEGEKMSKSKGNFILADDALNYAEADFFRYYFSSKLNRDISDINFSIDDFIQKINSDLIGKYINIPSRTLNFINKLNNSQVKKGCNTLTASFRNKYDQVIVYLSEKEYSKALKEIMDIADSTNTYISNEEPWNKAKNEQIDECISVCSEALNVFKDLNILISAIIPTTADKIFALLNINKQNYSNLCEDSLNNVNEFKPLLKRLEKDNFEGILDNNE